VRLISPATLESLLATNRLSNRELAARAGCSSTTVNNLRNGTRDGIVKRSTATDLADALGVDVEDLFVDDHEPVAA
jgi:DNA-binding Xre family transcriptional regulator